MSTPLFPLAVWQSGTNENSIPANDNALRVQVLMAPAVGVSDSEPASPDEDDIHIVGTAWGGFTTNNAVIYKGGTWLEFEAFEGWVKTIAGDVYMFDGSVWGLITEGGGGGGSGTAPVVTLAGTAYTLDDLTPGAWHEFTSATLVTITVMDDSAEPVPANAEYGIMSAGAAGVEIVVDNAAVIVPPKGGTLTMEQDDFAVLKRREADLYKLLGETEDAS